MSKLSIDASNIINGGGLEHLKNILLNSNSDYFKKIIIYGFNDTLSKFPDYKWIDLREIKYFQKRILIKFTI